MNNNEDFKLVERCFKVATKKYYDNNKTIYPGFIYTKEVFKKEQESKVKIKRLYVCDIKNAVNNKVYESLSKDQLELFNKLNNLNLIHK
jgi:L-2-hydroxyglutarate oxidase LhgO